MSWKALSTNYKDAIWSGLKKYVQIDNSDGTVSFRDETEYTNKELSFFGAKEANRMNEAINIIMSKVENGTDLYQAFHEYFETQKQLYETASNGALNQTKNHLTDLEQNGDNALSNTKLYLNNLKLSSDSALSEIEHNYEARMTSYESQQKQSFDNWFEGIRNQLSADVAANMQLLINEVEERLSTLERMTLQNDFSVPMVIDNLGTILTDDLGNAIVVDWKYRRED